MKAGTVMTRPVSVISPGDSVESAAIVMARAKSGILPVVSGRRLIGLITDRDIVTRAVAAGKPAATCSVDEVMTEEVHYCVEDDPIEDVAKRMGELGVRRMPVLDRDSAVIGIVSLDDIAVLVQSAHTVADALRGIAQRSRVPTAR